MIIDAALVRDTDGESVLLVRQQGPSDPRAYWVLPGGLVESDEIVTEGLAREVREETGLRVLEFGQLVYAMHSVDGANGSQYVAFVLEAAGWDGEIRPDDPDGYILEAAFVPTAEAIERLEQLPWEAMSRPIAAYLRGTHQAGALWLYRDHDGEQELVACLPASEIVRVSS